MPIKSRIRTIPHWPKQGIMFRDITPLLADAQVFREAVRRMCAAMDHRGPDGGGVEHRGAATLGTQRLAIFDLANGQQPMATAAGSGTAALAGATGLAVGAASPPANTETNKPDESATKSATPRKRFGIMVVSLFASKTPRLRLI